MNGPTDVPVSAPRTEGEPLCWCGQPRKSGRLHETGDFARGYSHPYDPKVVAAPEPQTVQGAASERPLCIACRHHHPGAACQEWRYNCDCKLFTAAPLPPPQPEGATVDEMALARDIVEACARLLLHRPNFASQLLVEAYDSTLQRISAFLRAHEAQIQAEAYEAAAKLVCTFCWLEGMPDEKGFHGDVRCDAWPIPAVAAALRAEGA